MRTIAACVVLAALAGDLSRPPARQFSATLALAAVHFYQAHLGTAAGRLGVRCRFTPTCSEYAAVVIARFGMARGGWLAARRLLRCGPWTRAGTFDPPPENPQPLSNLR